MTRTITARARSVALAVAAVALTWAHAAPARAQARAAIQGVVKDAAGAGLPTVTVILVENATQLERRVVTNPDGTFVFGGLLPGRFDMRVEESGFAPYNSGAVVLNAGDRRMIEVVLARLAVPPPAGQTGAGAKPPDTVPDYLPTSNRWDLEFPIWQRYPPANGRDYPYVRGGKKDPYNRNILKGDYPVIGQDVFFVLTAVEETPFEFRRVPTPSGVSAERPGAEPFFGKPDQYSVAPEAAVSLELFKGDTAFKPRTWAFRVTPAFNLNYVNTGERNVVSATPEEGTTRRRTDIALQEAFAEVKLADVSPNYDFVSIRAGIQPFTSDFRGFLFRDTNLGVRVFGNWGRNRNQWNVAYFDQLEKDTNSELNLTERRDQHVMVANYYRQDFLTQGYTISPSFHANFDRGETEFFDANGFLVRPAPIGLVQPHQVTAYYAGVGGDGHWGRLNVTHQFYQAFGTDTFNGIAGQPVDINAQFAAVEASVDHDWWRVKGTFLFASGDDTPGDNKAHGFDAILDAPNIAGGPFSFWNREGIRLGGTLLGLVGRHSVLPSLRSSKTEGQSNFVNPGLFEYGVGWDADLTQKVHLTTNVNLLRFQHTQVLSALLFQANIENAIGIDGSAGVQYRPFLNDNITITVGASVFAPSAGFKNLLTSDALFAPFAVLTLRY